MTVRCIPDGTPVQVFYLSNAFVSMVKVIRTGTWQHGVVFSFHFFLLFFDKSCFALQLLLQDCTNYTVVPLFLDKVLQHVFADVCISGALNPTGFLPLSI